METIFAKNVPEILAVLFLNRQKPVHQSKIVAITGLRIIQVQRALHRLRDERLIEEYKQGNMVSYKLRENHPLLSDLKNILYKTKLIAEPFKEAFETVINQIDIAIIYGSFADGSEMPESDIDVFIIGEIGLKQVSKILIPLAKQLQREINPVVYSKAEFLNKLELDDHFVANVMRSKKLWLVGDEKEFKAI